MRTTIAKIFTFEAAHKLPEHQGKCARVHGHSYKLEVSVTGTLGTNGSSAGMVMDFADVSAIVKVEVLDKWDHQFLNNVVSFTPTAELLAREVFHQLKKAGLPLSQIRLWETPNAYALVTSES